MGLAPLNTPAQHQTKTGRRAKKPQATIHTTCPPSPTRTSTLRGIITPGGSPVEESASSNEVFPVQSTDLSASVVEDVQPNINEMPYPPIPALYYQGGVVPQPLPELISLGLALQQRAGQLSMSTGSEEEFMEANMVASESNEKGARFWDPRALLGIGSLLVMGGLALFVHGHGDRISANEKKNH